jgi:UDP-galactopyranose mutase
MKNFDFLIVGTGLYGLTIARLLHDAGKKVFVIDKRAHIGGNCASCNINGIDVHLYGPHVFHTNNDIAWDFISRFDNFRQFTHKVLSNHNNQIYDFPINLRTMQGVYGHGIKKPMMQPDNSNLETYCISQIGKKLYKMFIKEYTEKQWGCKASELPASIIKRIPVRMNYNDSYFNDFYQGIPVNGWNKLFEKMLSGIDFELNTNFNDVKNGLWFNNIIYTGAIDEYFNYSEGRLDWRSLEFEIEGYTVKDFQGISVMHFPEKKHPFTRITEFKHFNPFNEAFNKDYTIISKEFPSVNNEPYYPIESEKNLSLLLKYQHLALKETNIFFGGRLGTYKYNDMDTTVINAINDFLKLQGIK